MLHIDRLDRIYPNAYFGYAHGCNEPGYDDKPVLLANWNHVPPHVFDKLESLGYSCEWSDEWATCSDCGKAVRTSPNSYDWTSAYVIQDGDLLCLECVDAQAFYESIENRPRAGASNEFTYRHNPEDHGYVKVNEDHYISGWHGRVDDPKKILSDLLSDDPTGRYIFALDYTSQFEIGFSVYRKRESWVAYITVFVGTSRPNSPVVAEYRGDYESADPMAFYNGARLVGVYYDQFTAEDALDEYWKKNVTEDDEGYLQWR